MRIKLSQQDWKSIGTQMEYEWKKTASGWGLEKRAGDPIYNLRYEGGREREKKLTTSGTLSFRRCEEELKRTLDREIRFQLKQRGITNAGSMVGLQYGDATWTGSSTLRVTEESRSEGYDANLEPRSGERRPEQRRETRPEYKLYMKGVAIYEGGKLSFSGHWITETSPERSGCKPFVTDGSYFEIGDYIPTTLVNGRKKGKLPWWRRIF